jgi:hypothetical protein
MKKRIFPLLQVILSFIVLISSGCQGRIASAPTIAVPDKKVTPVPSVTPLYKGNYNHLTWFYKPPSDIAAESVAKGFDLFILTHKDEQMRDQLKALGADQAPFLQYLALMEIQDPGSCDQKPYGNQVAYKPGDFCTISVDHPDWFLLDQNGQRIPSSVDGFWFMDPGNAEYQTFWLSRSKEMQTQFGWDGVFIDNAEASLDKFRKDNLIPARYPTDVSFQTAVINFLGYLHEGYFKPAKRPMFANITSLDDYNIWMQYANYLDGMMIEAFAVDWNTGYLLPQEWEAQIGVIQWALNQNKTVLLVAQGSQKDSERQQFAYASYLLVNNGNAFFRYTNADNYGDLWNYPNTKFDLGLPLGPLYRDGFNWKRDFEHGSVSVNPTTHASEIKLN